MDCLHFFKVGKTRMIEKNLENVLISEIMSLKDYFERILHVFEDGPYIQATPSANKLFLSLEKTLTGPIANFIFPDELKTTSPMKNINTRPSSLSLFDLAERLNNTLDLIKIIIQLKNNNLENYIEKIVDYINQLYLLANKFHTESLNHFDIQIQQPCLNILDAFFNDKKNSATPEHNLTLYDHTDWPGLNTEIPIFELNLDNLQGAVAANGGEVELLQKKRYLKYEELKQLGHSWIFQKENERGLQQFLKAYNYHDCAEILNLIGWAYSLLKNEEMAKSYTLKAINKDPDYGPSYNDLGIYLLNEGKVNEAIKWFQLAKKAIHSKNQEHPYINCGRAYIMLKDYPMALEEFSLALTIAPFHDELHATVEGLKKTLNKKDPEFKAPLNFEIGNSSLFFDNPDIDPSPVL